MIRLYVDVPFTVGAIVMLPESEWFYLKSVRRARGEVRLFNRNSQEATGEILEKERAFKIASVMGVSLPAYDLTVAVGFPETAVAADLVRSLSEMGARKLIFFAAERSQSSKWRESSLERFQKISIEAARQCGRGIPLEVCFSKSWTSEPRPSCIWFLDEAVPDDAAEEKISGSFEKRSQDRIENAMVVVGCEGGWTEAERQHARELGVKTVHFDMPILRVGTAAICAAFYAIEQMERKG